jgi:hypothetical protein
VDHRHPLSLFRRWTVRMMKSTAGQSGGSTPDCAAAPRRLSQRTCSADVPSVTPFRAQVGPAFAVAVESCARSRFVIAARASAEPSPRRKPASGSPWTAGRYHSSLGSTSGSSSPRFGAAGDVRGTRAIGLAASPLGGFGAGDVSRVSEEDFVAGLEPEGT